MLDFWKSKKGLATSIRQELRVRAGGWLEMDTCKYHWVLKHCAFKTNLTRNRISWREGNCCVNYDITELKRKPNNRRKRMEELRPLQEDLPSWQRNMSHRDGHLWKECHCQSISTCLAGWYGRQMSGTTAVCEYHQRIMNFTSTWSRIFMFEY